MADAYRTSSVFGRLLLILDLNPARWASFFEEHLPPDSGPRLRPSPFLDHIFAFVHQYTTLNRVNKVSLMTMSPEWCVESFVCLKASRSPFNFALTLLFYSSSLYYPLREQSRDYLRSKSPSESFNFADFRTGLEAAVAAASGKSPTIETPSNALAIALTRAFLHLNREETDMGAERELDNDAEIPAFFGTDNFPARIIVFSVTPDDSSHAISTLNAIFAAHKQNITIDSVFISYLNSSPMLQAAAELTNGCYFKLHCEDDLPRVLLSSLLVDAPFREELKLPKLVRIDHKATCFCHKRPQSIGYVCSVCLAVFCEPQQPCQMCGVEYVADSLPSPLAVAINTVPS